MARSTFALLLAAALLAGAHFGFAEVKTNTPARSADTNTTAIASNTPNTVVAPSVDTEQLQRAVVRLQEQLQATQREIQQARADADAAANRTTETIGSRLDFIEAQQLRAMESSTRLTLIVVGIIAFIACLAVILSGWVQMRAANRLGDISRQLATLPALAAPPVFAQLGNGETVTSTAAVQAGTDRVLNGIDALNRRVDDLAHAAAGPRGTSHSPESNGSSTNGARIATTISKGQALLNLDQADQALACFEEAIAIDPRNIEAWIKKGTALERLQRIDDAVAAYDRAIEADETTATAYLFKAGVFNRQKRYAEALQCYEKALALQKSRAAA